MFVPSKMETVDERGEESGKNRSEFDLWGPGESKWLGLLFSLVYSHCGNHTYLITKASLQGEKEMK